MIEDLEEKPVTLSQLKAEMTSLLARFYADILESRFQSIDERFNRVDAKLDEHDQRFDDLYKKFEVLHHEYILSNEQMRLIRAQISQKLSH